jgi:hypothetical protein
MPIRAASLLTAEDAFDDRSHILVAVGTKDDRDAILDRSVNHKEVLDRKTPKARRDLGEKFRLRGTARSDYTSPRSFRSDQDHADDSWSVQ